MAKEKPTPHTPGPWKLEREPDEILGELIRVQTPLGPVCTLVGDEADAHLIAAAPDLLAALSALFEHCAMVHKHWGDGSNQREADAAIAAGRAAIARAEGRG